MHVIRRAGAWLFSRPYLLLSLTSLAWAGNFIAGRAVAGIVPPIAFAQIRWTGAALLVLPLAWPHLKKDWPAIRASWPVLLVLSATGIGMFNTFAYVGLQYTTAVNGALMQSMVPLLIGLWSWALFRDRLTALQLAGILVSFVGVAVIIGRGDLGRLATLTFNQGDLWLVGAMASYAIYSALLRRSPQIHFLSFLVVTFVLGDLMILPFFLMELASGRVIHFGAEALLAILYVVIFPSAVAYMLFNRGVALIGANRAGPFFHLIPVFASAMGVLFLGEELRPYHGIGYALILAGIAIAQRTTNNKRRGAA